jgi:hypothetical protein
MDDQEDEADLPDKETSLAGLAVSISFIAESWYFVR